MKSDRSKRRHREKIYELLLGLCLMVLVSFAFPRLSWIGLPGYALIALLLTQLVMIRKETLTLRDRLYQLLGLGALSCPAYVANHPYALGGERRSTRAHLECVGGLERDPLGGAIVPGTESHVWVADGSCRWLFAVGAHSWFGDECGGNHSTGQFRATQHPSRIRQWGERQRADEAE